VSWFQLLITEKELMPATKNQDAIALLKEDHRAVEKLFNEFEGAKGEGRKETLARRICLELTVHTKIEEEIFYPACDGKIDEDLLKEAYVEHDAAKLLMAEIEAGNGQSDEFFDAKVQVLSEQIEHHVKEEETELFPQVRKAELDLEALGHQLADRKKELLKTYKAEGVPEPELQTMDEVSI
jgi:hemerythrin superfamily protein